MKYIYKFYGGKCNRLAVSYDRLPSISALNPVGFTEDYTTLRAKGVLCHRAELDNQPIFEGYLGPMFDGYDGDNAVIRYESQEVYDMLST